MVSNCVYNSKSERVVGVGSEAEINFLHSSPEPKQFIITHQHQLQQVATIYHYQCIDYNLGDCGSWLLVSIPMQYIPVYIVVSSLLNSLHCPFTTLTYLIVHVTELLRYLLTALITMSRTIKYLQVSIFCICQRIKNLGQRPRAKIRSHYALPPCSLLAVY